MGIKSYPLYHGTSQMMWGKGVVVKEPKGFVFLAGSEGLDPTVSEPWPKGAVVVEGGIEAQTRLTLEKIKSRLEEMGSSLENICHLWWYLKGPEFPDGIAYSPNMIKARKVREEFFKEHAPSLCMDKNPPPSTLLSVPSLAFKDMLIEITVIAALTD